MAAASDAVAVDQQQVVAERIEGVALLARRMIDQRRRRRPAPRRRPRSAAAAAAVRSASLSRADLVIRLKRGRGDGKTGRHGQKREGPLRRRGGLRRRVNDLATKSPQNVMESHATLTVCRSLAYPGPAVGSAAQEDTMTSETCAPVDDDLAGFAEVDGDAPADVGLHLPSPSRAGPGGGPACPASGYRSGRTWSASSGTSG